MQHTVGQGCCAQVQPCCVLSKRKHAGQRRSIPVQCSSSFNENGATNNRGGPAGAFTTGSEAAARQQLFNRIAPIYDQFNDVLSLGQHRVWKKMAVKWSGAKRGSKALDVCCGSGDLAMLLAQTVGPTGEVVGLDFAAEMLADASRRQQEREQLRGAAYNVQWVQGDALKLPFDANTFDAATIGYGLRNVANIPQALGELHRVLAPGARVAILDFNNASTSNPAAAGFQTWTLDNVVVPLARVYGVEEEYAYLVPSIQAFPSGREQEQLARDAGFSAAKHYEIAMGLMGCLVAQK